MHIRSAYTNIHSPGQTTWFRSAEWNRSFANASKFIARSNVGIHRRTVKESEKMDGNGRRQCRVNERNKVFILLHRLSSLESFEKPPFYALADGFLAAFADYLAIQFVTSSSSYSSSLWIFQFWFSFFVIDGAAATPSVSCLRASRFWVCNFFGNNICLTLIKFGIQNEYFIVNYSMVFYSFWKLHLSYRWLGRACRRRRRCRSTNSSKWQK